MHWEIVGVVNVVGPTETHFSIKKMTINRSFWEEVPTNKKHTKQQRRKSDLGNDLVLSAEKPLLTTDAEMNRKERSVSAQFRCGFRVIMICE